MDRHALRARITLVHDVIAGDEETIVAAGEHQVLDVIHRWLRPSRLPLALVTSRGHRLTRRDADVTTG